MTISIALATLIALIFAALGLAKILALAPMREAAAHAGFSTTAFRGIGVLEVAGAAGVSLGLVVPLLGGLAGAGLLALLGGALTTHLRKHDRAPALAPAAACAVLVTGYLAALLAATG